MGEEAGHACGHTAVADARTDPEDLAGLGLVLGLG